MIEKEIDFNEDAREKLLGGVTKLSDAVRQTLGAGGNTVILEDDLGRPHVTKDGVTVAKSINLSDPVEHLGATVVKEASVKTADEAGDGTTTSVVLTQAIIEAAYKVVESKKLNVSELRRCIEVLKGDVVKTLEKRSKAVTQKNLIDVATISANNDSELGEIIADAYTRVGVDGAVTIEQSMGRETYTEIVNGTRMQRGYHSPYLITDQEKNLAVLEKPVVFISDKKINIIEDIEQVLQFSIQNKRPLFLVAEIETAVMNTLNVNKARGVIQINVVEPEGVGMNRYELLSDLALMTGSTVISDETGYDFSAITPEFLGSCEKVVSSSKETIITLTETKESKKLIKARAEQVRTILKEKKDTENDWHYTDRLSRLSGGVAAIYVGAMTEVEMKEKKDRVEDAIFATRAALEEGIVAGGGVALFNVAVDLNSRYFKEKNKEMKEACIILSNAMTAPIQNILENAGMSYDEFMAKMDKVRLRNYGYNVKNKRFGNMFKLGIIDPLKVTKNAVINAISVGVTMLTTNCVISNKRA